MASKPKPKNWKHPIKVGQTLLFISSSGLFGTKPREVVVTNIGTRWGGISNLGSNMKFSLASFEVFQGEYAASVGRLYLNKQEHRDEQESLSAWLRLRGAIAGRSTFPLVTPLPSAETIQKAAELLGVVL